MPEDTYWDDGDGDLSEEEDDEFDCGLDSDGFCGKIGSEECDMECPYRDEIGE